jgi:hypothetical protein
MNGWRETEGPRRRTWPALREVLVVIRNLTSWDRLTDLLPLFAGDERVNVTYTVDRGSNFSAGIERYLTSIGVEVTPWEEAVEREYTLVLAAHANSHMCLLRGPIFLVPHGAGYNRRVVENTGDPNASVGTSERELMCDGVVIPAIIGVSHPRQARQIRRSCPATADRVRLIGDPTFDRMAASWVMRREYRRALGVDDGRRLVVVSSTWGQHSLLGKMQNFVHVLVAQLPMDEFQVALVLHPNIWVGHIPYNVSELFRDARDGGLLLIPPDLGWRAALIAADLVLGDHGSVTFYGAALRRPTAQVVDGSAELDPDSALALFCRNAIRLDRWGGLRDQLASLTRDYDPLLIEQVSEEAIGARNQSWQIIHDTIYELLDLTPPDRTPRMLPIPLPQPMMPGTTTSFLTSAYVDARSRSVFLARFPGSLSERHRPPNDPTDYFRVVDACEVHQPTCDNADVFVNQDPLPENDAYTWMNDTARDYPSAKVVAAATESACLIWLRNRYGRPNVHIRVTTVGHGPVDAFAASAAMYGWVAADQQLANGVLELTVSMGCRSYVLRFERTER